MWYHTRMLSRRSKRATIGFLFTTITVLLLLFSVARYFSAKEEKRRYLEEKSALRVAEPNVVTVEAQPHIRKRRYPAELRPWLDAKVPAEVAGVVVNTAVEPGSRVRKGDVLVTLDPRMAEIEVGAWRTRHAENQRLLAEASTLKERSVASRTELEAAAARAAVSGAELESAEERLQRHTVFAPFDGVVNTRMVDVGDAVGAYQPVADLVDLNRFRAVFYVGDVEVAAFAEGQTVDLILPGMPGRVFKPVVRFVAGAAERESRLFRIEAELAGEEAQGLPGRVQAVVEAEIAVYRDIPFVPAAAVAIVGRTPTVQRLLESGKTEPAGIEIGPEIDGAYPVLSGLKTGDRIVIR